MMFTLFVSFLSFVFGFSVHAVLSYQKVSAGEELFSRLERKVFCRETLTEEDYKTYELLKPVYREG